MMYVGGERERRETTGYEPFEREWVRGRHTCITGEYFSSGIERVTVSRDTGPPGGPGAFLAPAERDGQMIEAFPNPKKFRAF